MKNDCAQEWIAPPPKETLRPVSLAITDKFGAARSNSRSEKTALANSSETKCCYYIDRLDASMPVGIMTLVWKMLETDRPCVAYTLWDEGSNQPRVEVTTFVPFSDHVKIISIPAAHSKAGEYLKFYKDLKHHEALGASASETEQLFVSWLKYEQNCSFERNCEILLTKELLTHSHDWINAKSFSNIMASYSFVETLLHICAELTQSFQLAKGEPVNLRILAGRMGETGAAISTISKNYEMMAADIHATVEQLVSRSAGVIPEMQTRLQTGIFDLLIAELLYSVLEVSGRDADGQEDSYLNEQHRTAISQYHNCSQCHFRRVTKLGGTLPGVVRRLKRRIKGLDLVKLLCRVENGRLSKPIADLETITARLEESHRNQSYLLNEFSLIAQELEGLALEIDSNVQI